MWPFLQFSKYRGNLAQLSLESVLEYLRLDNAITAKSFRYEYQEEKQLLPILQRASKGEPNITSAGDLDFIPIAKNIFNETTSVEITLPCAPCKANKKITIAIGNLKVPFPDISKAYEPDERPNLSQERWQALSGLLNLANKEKCDLLVLPEVSIPWAWLPLMTSYARRHRIGLIFGLEHLVVSNEMKKQVTNTVIAALPYFHEGILDCAVIARSKCYYSPVEIHEFDRLKYEMISPDPKRYHLIHWRGMTFTIFNCFELTDIVHRSVFRGKIDALFVVEWNRDIEYFSNIVESAARDLHCTVIQTNTSDFGDSRIYSPFHESHKRNLIRVKGGDNMTLLKTTLDFTNQRGFQQRRYSPSDERYKPTPAGFEYERNTTANQPFEETIDKEEAEAI